MASLPSPAVPPPAWQGDKHLRSGDRVWFLTDIERYYSAFYPWSVPQELFKVGIYDLSTGKVGFAVFGRDIAFALMKIQLPPPPWKQPLSFGIELHREGHEDDEEKGRYHVQAKLITLEPEVLALAPQALKRFASGNLSPNAFSWTWDDLVVRATNENAIEAAVRITSGPFSAGEIKKIVGKGVPVTAVLKRLVEEGVLLPPTGKRRSTKYELAPMNIVQRVDWTG